MRAAVASSAARTGSSITDESAAASATGSSGGTSSPVEPGRISSTGPSTAAATTGTPAENASSTTLPSGSCRLGQASTVLAASRLAWSVRQPSRCSRPATFSRRASSNSASRSGPSPAMTACTPGQCGKARTRTSKALLRCSRPSASTTGVPGGTGSGAGVAPARSGTKFGRWCTRPAGQPWRSIQPTSPRVLATRWSQRRKRRRS
jgi:hypothetical protein